MRTSRRRFLQDSGAETNAEPVRPIGAYRPPEWDGAKEIDADRYRKGLPNQLDLG
jgi:hypothetical protein